MLRCFSRNQLFPTLWTLQPPRFLCPWDSLARMLEWVVISYSRGSSQPRDWIHVSWIASGFFTFEPPRNPQPSFLPLLYFSMFTPIFLMPLMLVLRVCKYCWSLCLNECFHRLFLYSHFVSSSLVYWFSKHLTIMNLVYILSINF